MALPPPSGEIYTAGFVKSIKPLSVTQWFEKNTVTMDKVKKTDTRNPLIKPIIENYPEPAASISHPSNIISVRSINIAFPSHYRPSTLTNISNASCNLYRIYFYLIHFTMNRF
jgi:hypothetical protein